MSSKAFNIALLVGLLFSMPSVMAGPSEVRPIHLGIFYPWSTNGHNAPNIANNFSAHLFWAVSAGVEGFEIAGFGSTVDGDVNGFQTAGFMNVTDGTVHGFQTAGFMNVVNGSVQGLQTSGFMNIADGPVNGLQAAGFMNIADEIQVLQLSGFMSISAHAVLGAQGAGFMNVSASVNGLQAAGFMNVTEELNGLQNAGFINIAENVNGLQTAGFINIAQKVNGIMVAGFMNIAERCDYPIGPINIIGNGRRSLHLSGDELGVMGLTFKSGSKTFGIIGGGYHPNETVFRYNGAAGLGFHQMMTENLALNLEAVSTIYMTDLHFNDLDQTAWIHSFKLLLDCPIGRKFGIFAGPTMNLLQAHQSEAFEKTPSALWEKQDQADSHPFQKLWIGAQAGIYYML